MGVRRWNGDEIAELRRLAREGASAPDIARVLGRSTGAVQQKALELGVSLARANPSEWRRRAPGRST